MSKIRAKILFTQNWFNLYKIKWIMDGSNFVFIMFGDRLWMVSAAARQATGMSVKDMLRGTIEVSTSLRKNQKLMYWKRYEDKEKKRLVAIKFMENGQWFFDIDYVMNLANKPAKDVL